MVSIESQIWANIQQKGRGAIFFPSDFTDFGETKAVGKSLERLTAKGQIVRLARGIYCYPQVDEVYGLGVIMPTIEQIAQTIARRDMVHIASTGIYALNRLGLSTQVPMNFVYLTDGSPRRVNLGENRSILFVRTSPKNLAFSNPLAMLVTFALKEVGPDNFTDDMAAHVKSILQKEKKENVLADAQIMPAWIRSFVKKAYA